MSKISQRIGEELTADEERAAAMDAAAFTDVHVTLDWVIRVHGTSDSKDAANIATDYLADQDLHRMVETLTHEDGVLCADDDLYTDTDENGNLAETELTIALYPEGSDLPTDADVAVATYDSITGQAELRS